MSERWRKKAVVVEVSAPLTPENAQAVAGWAAQSEVTEDGVFIRTLEGTHHASWGDRIIRGVQGEFYPCKPDIFAATYEPAVGAPAPDALREALERLVTESVCTGNKAEAYMVGYSAMKQAEAALAQAPRAPAPSEAAAPEGKVIDLMAALKKSLARGSLPAAGKETP